MRKLFAICCLCSVVVFSGCATMGNKALSRGFFDNKNQKVGVLVLEPTAEKQYFASSDGLLGMALLAGASISNTKFCKNLTDDRFQSMVEKKFVEKLNIRGIEASAIDRAQLARLPEVTNLKYDKNFDYAKLAEDNGVDKLLVAHINNSGYVRMHVLVFPISPVKSYALSSGKLYNQDNKVEWSYRPSMNKTSVNTSVRFKNLVKTQEGYDKAIDKSVDALVQDFFKNS